MIAGEIEMSAVAEALEGKGRIVILEGTYGHEPQLQRKRGYDNVLKEYPDIEVVATQTGKWYRNEAMAVMENWLQADMGIDAVVAENDEMALGALKAIEEAVRREVKEEAGIEVGEVTYHSSQPWPFPSSLMIGCHARALTTEINRDEEEMSDVRWFTRAEILSALKDENPDLKVPGPIAIAHHIIKAWAEGEVGD